MRIGFHFSTQIVTLRKLEENQFPVLIAYYDRSYIIVNTKEAFETLYETDELAAKSGFIQTLDEYTG